MKPMLAATYTQGLTLNYPLWVSPKLDGVRALIQNGCVLSRSWKPIPNRKVQAKFSHLEGLDGELIVGPPTAKDCYRRTVSEVMTASGFDSELKFFAFDHTGSPNDPYSKRHSKIPKDYALEQHICRCENELLGYETRFLLEGYEGAIIRNPSSSYKNGRSTVKEQGMLKLKRFLDDEAVVTGFEELMHNGNPAIVNALGHREHSSHKANLVPMGTLGAIVAVWKGKTFRVGTGFTDAERSHIWGYKEHLEGKLIRFKYLEVGMKDLPRHPVFLGWRASADL